MADSTAIPIPQIRTLAFHDEEIGMGFNSATGLAVGTCLEGFSVEDTGLGQEVFSTIDFVESHDQLMSAINFSFEAQGRYGFFAGGVKTDFSESTTYNSTSTFLIAKVIVRNPIRRGKNFKVVADPPQRLLTSLRFDEFKTAFGDSFVRGLQTGGEFYAVFRFTSISKSKETDLAATAHAEANGLLVGGSFKGKFEDANKSESTRAEFSALMYQHAGTGAEVSPTTNIEDVFSRFRAFPTIAQAHPAAYETEIATYTILPLNTPTPEEQQDFLFALRDARDHKLQFIQARNDVELALLHPELFDGLPSSDSLKGASIAYTKLINAVVDHATRLSRGEFSPPKLFDPSSLNPALEVPVPPALKRKVPAPASAAFAGNWRLESGDCRFSKLIILGHDAQTATIVGTSAGDHNPNLRETTTSAVFDQDGKSLSSPKFVIGRLPGEPRPLGIPPFHQLRMTSAGPGSENRLVVTEIVTIHSQPPTTHLSSFTRD